MSTETSSMVPELPLWQAIPETQELLDFAELPTINLGESATAEGHNKVAMQMIEALVNHGTVYIINHGYSVFQMSRIYDIADVPFSQLSAEEKQGHSLDARREPGFKFHQYYEMEDGLYDEMETYNLVYAEADRTEQPKALRPFLPELYAFGKHNHFNVVHPLLRLIEAGLGIPENTLVDIHGFTSGEVALMKYFPSRNGEVRQQSERVWLSGETTKNTLSLIYSQPVMAFQILQRDGKWRYVKHVENAIILNVGEGLEILSGGFFKATVHRVVRPPIDQRHAPRLGIFYFLFANSDVKMAPVLQDNHLLTSTGCLIKLERRFEAGFEPTTYQYRYGVGVKRQSVILEENKEQKDEK